VLFDAIAPLQVDASAFRRNWEQFFEYFPGPVGYELRGLKVTADGGAGFSSSLARLAGTDREGKEQGGWMRQTVGYRKIDGAWRITHEHWSAPIDMETGKAQHDLTPE
jgi:PhnB protein